ncbi:MAG: outer membrane beta-barrel protein [Gemmatimonadales bacterium]
MRNVTRAVLASLGLLLLVPASDALAQRRRGLVDVSHSHERHGLWLAVGLAAGEDAYRFSAVSEDYGEGLTKPTFSLGIGGTVNPHLRLGGELKVWADEYFDEVAGADVTESLVGGLLVAQVYPARSFGLFLKGGVGISRSGVDVEFGDGTGETGFATLVGAGYELRVGRNFFITPMVDLMHHRSSERGDPNGTLHERLISFGVNLTFQPGR